MQKWKVRDVCKATGLNRKKLYDYQDVVKPIEYENQAGYKIYDDEGLKKFQLIALLIKLDIPKRRIKDILTNDYSWEHIMDEVIKGKKQEIEHNKMIIDLANNLKKTKEVKK